MGKLEKVEITGADVAKLSAGELRTLLDKREGEERAAAQALAPLREAEAAAARAVEAYEKDLQDAILQREDAKKWVQTVSEHCVETEGTLKRLKEEHAAATKALQDAATPAA
jgi:hypothetical protein